MNDEPEWTPTRGILTALRVLGLRLSFGFVAYTAIMYFAWSLIQQLPLLALLVGVVGMAGALLGLPMGLLAARRLVERSGFAGPLLMAIAVGCIIVMYVVSYHLVVALRGDAGIYGSMVAFCMAGGSIIACTKTIMLD